ncbi:MAG TPA: glycoside hydrolase family 2 protein [Termitinemataceae bacterium]|nr:glycoside hydrolase family 2 protein [Termitinemataceae bacterium]HOM24017.1 glycoside hydrolase family 2 protein [Termitinemataceae bacterium]HPQ00604.1 glycoside hydrolase family 2 protein [Termitinemataceae bacterium]
MECINLAGPWQLHVDGDTEGIRDIPCIIPGDIFSALLKENILPDPYYGKNEEVWQVLNQKDIELSYTFSVSSHMLEEGDPYLFLESVDTVADIYLNNSYLGHHENMFYPFYADIDGILREGENTLKVWCYSAEKRAIERSQELPYPIPYGTAPIHSPHRNLVRKVQCHSGWDWGPCLMVSGIYGKAYIGFNRPGHISYCTCRPMRRTESLWDLETVLHYTIPGRKEGPSRWELVVHYGLVAPDGKVVIQEERQYPVAGPGEHLLTANFTVPKPQLWWPAGYGEQPLYTLTVQVSAFSVSPEGLEQTYASSASQGFSVSGEPSETLTKRIGFRTLEVLTQEDSIGRPLTFRINGRDIWVKGANWIPLDALPSRQTPDRYRQLLGDMVAAHMNMVRVWGGGQYEQDIFYDLCDELGILVWQDCMFACAMYPATPEFLSNVQKEIAYQVLRLKDHPCLALWCGNNENLGALNWFPETKQNRDRYIIDYDRLNEGIVGNTIRALDPDHIFWPSSPSGGPQDFSDNWHADAKGDMHYWSVWHEGKPFEAYYEVVPRFCSEFGYQSFPSVETVATYCPQEEWNLTSPIMEHHQKSPRGNSLIIENFSRYFRFPVGFKNMLYLSQVQQAMAIQTAVEYWRSQRPRCMGALYWQLNDCWPVASWSSIEYSGKWKLLHYRARRFFAPVALVSYIKEGRLSVILLNDTDQDILGDVTVRVFDFSGKLILERVYPCEGKKEGATVILQESIENFTSRPEQHFMHATFKGSLSEDSLKVTGVQDALQTTSFFTLPKKCYLQDPVLTFTIEKTKTGLLQAVLSVERPAFFVALDVEGVPGYWEDNCVTLLPGEPRRITYLPRSGITLPSETEFKERCRVYNLWGCSQE